MLAGHLPGARGYSNQVWPRVKRAPLQQPRKQGSCHPSLRERSRPWARYPAHPRGTPARHWRAGRGPWRMGDTLLQRKEDKEMRFEIQTVIISKLNTSSKG